MDTRNHDSFSPHCVDAAWFAARATAQARAELRAGLGIGVQTKVALLSVTKYRTKRPLDLIARAVPLSGEQTLCILVA
jgi:hypothetical protein